MEILISSHQSMLPPGKTNGPALLKRGRVGFSRLRFRRYYLPKPKLKLTPLRGRPKEGR